MYGRNSSASRHTRESSALLNRNPSSQSRRYLKPVDILREVRNSNEALDQNLAVPVPYSKVQQYRAVSNHRNDGQYNYRANLGSRAEKSIQAHINRGQKARGNQSDRSALENYNGVSEGVVEVSPEYA